jgi:uncharacterized protein with NRDE domain
MCVLAMAWRAHPRWRLVVAGNRDELHARPAEPLARWPEDRSLLAGRDLLSGGTWLGVSEQGRFAVVTNLRGFGGPRPEAPSRGLLLKDLLLGNGPFADPDDPALAAFSPFNLIQVQGGEAAFWTNQPAPVRRRLEAGIYGLSNGRLDEPWPKTVRLKAIMEGWLSADATSPAALLDGLQEDRLTGPADLPVEPSDVPLEPRVSPIFIRNPVYGTRCGTVVAIDAEGQGIIIERRFDAAGAVSGQTALPFAWPA